MWDGLIWMKVNFLCVEFVVRLAPPLFDNSTRLPGIFHPTKHVLADMEPQFRLTSGREWMWPSHGVGERRRMLHSSNKMMYIIRVFAILRGWGFDARNHFNTLEIAK